MSLHCEKPARQNPALPPQEWRRDTNQTLPYSSPARRFQAAFRTPPAFQWPWLSGSPRGAFGALHW
eukprot:12925238-Prorocentrum_lima.AAC.1